MRKHEHPSASASVLQIARALALLVIFAILLPSNLNASAPQPGFYPPLPEAPTPAPPPTACDVPEEFDAINDLVTKGWVLRNNSLPLGTTNWFQGNTTVFGSQAGVATNSYIAANYQNGSGTAAISNWLITPPVILQDGAQLSFWTRTVNFPLYPDRLQVRMSLNGTSSDVGSTATSVGDFTILLYDINQAYSQNGYPNAWTNIVATLSGIASPVEGRLAFRYFVENGGPNGFVSDYIGIDSVEYCCTSKCGFPTPTPIPSPTPIPTPTPIPPPTPTPCSCGGTTITGTIANCSKVSRAAPVPNVTLTGFGGATRLTGQDGHYSFLHMKWASFQFVTVTPSMAALTPTSVGINTVDVVTTQRQFLALGTPLSGCRLTAADVDGDSNINTVDVIAIQRFFLGFTTGIGNVGKYRFTPASKTYFVFNGANYPNDNYSALLFGDVAAPFVQ